MANTQQPNPINTPPQVPEGTPGYGNTRRDIGNALMQYGGNLLASGAAEYFESPTLGQAIAGLSDATSQIMHQRFWKAEFENFQQSYGQQYQTAAQQIWQAYNETDASFGDKYDDESIKARTAAMQDLMSKIQQLDIQFMQNAAKFGHNPLIGNLANGLLQQRAQWMQGMLGAYGEVVTDANAQASLKKAQFMVSPEMQELTLEEKRAGIAHKKAQTSETYARTGLLGAQAAAVGRESIDKMDIGNVPAGKLPDWLISTTRGREILKPYAQQAEARLRERLIEQDPRLKYDTDELDIRVRKAAPQIRKEAVAAVLQEYLPGDALASVLSDNQKVSRELLSEEVPTRSPSVVKQESPKEIKKKVVEEGGMGPSLVLPAVEYLAKQESVKTFNDLKKQIEAAIKEEVESMVGKFEGDILVKEKYRKELMDYFRANWKKSAAAAQRFGSED